jgi:peptide-methionine (S)-S-oxide reductase
MTGQIQQAMFGAGCFWGVQYYFDQVPGVVKTTVGYSGGHTENPDYYQIHEEDTGHAEVTLLEFDPAVVSYETLVRHFFRMHNPTLRNSDGINFGSNYRSCAFYYDDMQKEVLERVRDQLQPMYEDPIVTEIMPAKKFWEAEPFHQKFTERTGRGTCHVPYEPLESGEARPPQDHKDTMSKLRGWLEQRSK